MRVLLLVLAAPLALAQPAPRFTFDTPAPSEGGGFGIAIEAVGDLDGDGVSDVVVSGPDEVATLADGSTVDDGGQVHAFSGATGAFLRTYVAGAPETDAYFGDAMLAAGDVDGDGVADFFAAASREVVGGLGDAGRVYLLSGADGTVIEAFASPSPGARAEFGFDLARLADLTGDGVGEIGVSERGRTVDGLVGAGVLHILDGATRAPVFAVTAPVPQEVGLFGYTSADAGDVTGDGVPDVVTGEPGRDVGALRQVGRMYLVSGATGAVVREYRSPNEVQVGGFGRWVAGLGDVTGDGVPDLATGANGEQPNGLQYGGRAYVVSGADGSFPLKLVSPDVQAIGFFGELVEAVPDLDGDGRTDLAVSARAEDDDAIGPNVYVGRVYLFSSATGALLATLKPPTPDPDGIQYFGYGLASLGDLDGDGRPEIGVGAWGENDPGAPQWAGRAYVFSGALPTAASGGPAGGAALAVWPNPAAGPVTVGAELAEPGRARLEVVDVRGRTVAVVLDGPQPAGPLRATVDGSGWAPGVYVVRLVAGGAVSTARLAVAR